MKLNLIPFSPISNHITLSLYPTKAPGSHPFCLFTHEHPEWWQQHTALADQKELYFTLDNNAAILSGQEDTATINLYNLPRIALLYFRHLLCNHLKDRLPAIGADQYITAYNKISDFCMNFLFVEDFKILKINANDLMTVPNNIICEIPNVSNRL